MDGTIIQDKHEWMFSGVLLKEVLQESDERFAITSFGDLVDNFIGDPIVGTKEMTPLWPTGVSEFASGTLVSSNKPPGRATSLACFRP